jgi:hypothetical protein
MGGGCIVCLLSLLMIQWVARVCWSELVGDLCEVCDGSCR